MQPRQRIAHVPAICGRAANCGGGRVDGPGPEDLGTGC